MKFVVFCVIFSGIGFYAGYEFAKQTLIPEPPPPEVVIREVPAPRPEPEPEPEPEVPVVSVEEVPEPELPEARQLEVPGAEGFEARAARRVVTLIDKQGRDLVAEIIGAEEDYLRIRRQSDFAIFNVSFESLSREDRYFAEYLRDQARADALNYPGAEFIDSGSVEFLKAAFGGNLPKIQ